MKKITSIPDAWTEISDLFVALGDAHRQRILLSFEKNERLTILQVVEASQLSRTAVTHHLKVLERGGALKSEKVGREVYFQVNKDWMQQALHNVLQYVEEEI
ncbi:ArsR/SmtB family transcription factor [Methylophilus aquaticus]|uniref:Helix-turn-helix domain-containing protein n=1 Tax=Methylophilus aquaticus TaxID=1971610 RepID=A0ABT9JNY0_9PROT|nr:winged helix-turn-helix transcriptional regulator [Methylophilus aquaticus]MDP8566296.1 helix-turn-helix domain-containing protein [Methylophilus aquaticus]